MKQKNNEDCLHPVCYVCGQRTKGTFLTIKASLWKHGDFEKAERLKMGEPVICHECYRSDFDGVFRAVIKGLFYD